MKIEKQVESLVVIGTSEGSPNSWETIETYQFWKVKSNPNAFRVLHETS